MNFGIVYWITGLSGAGKTTIGKLLFESIKRKKDNVVFLDGDNLRMIFGNDLGYSMEDRKKSSERNSRLCKMLSDQGIDVVCATISMFHEVRKWNSDNIKNYKEIYLKASQDILVKRNQKGLYKKVLNGEQKNVAGMDLKVEEPLNPNIEIINDGIKNPEEVLKLILDELL